MPDPCETARTKLAEWKGKEAGAMESNKAQILKEIKKYQDKVDECDKNKKNKPKKGVQVFSEGTPTSAMGNAYGGRRTRKRNHKKRSTRRRRILH